MEKSTWNYGCSCKAEKQQECRSSGATLPEISVVKIVRTKVEEIGTFSFTASSWALYADYYFERNKNYTGLLQLASPLRTFLEITEVCNLKCQWCYFGEKSKKSMSLEHIKKIVDNLKNGWVMGIQLLWWEPTLHPKFIDICRHIHEVGLRLEMVSNGMVMNPELVQEMKQYVDACSISIDWPKDIHNEIRWNKRSYDNAVNAIELLRENEIPNSIIITIGKKNFQCREFILELISTYKNVLVKLLVSPDTSLALNSEERKEFYTFLRDSNIAHHLLTDEQPNSTVFQWCPAGNFSGYIDFQGNVYSCLYKRKPTEILWNLLNSPIEELWKTAHEKSLERRKMCHTCSKKTTCWWLCDIKW